MKISFEEEQKIVNEYLEKLNKTCEKCKNKIKIEIKKGNKFLRCGYKHRRMLKSIWKGTILRS